MIVGLGLETAYNGSWGVHVCGYCRLYALRFKV